jgi:3-phenylpropionate/cinnamic acid dioxygenase small subunit
MKLPFSTMSAETEIANLLYRYAEFMDTGDFAGAAALFDHARLRVGGGGDGTVDAATILTVWESGVRRYPDGTPRTKHVVTNPIIEVDEAAGTATCRSYYTVLQQTDGLPLQPIVAGRYHDDFERVDGKWRYAFRDYSLMDMVGDVSHHLQGPIAHVKP